MTNPGSLKDLLFMGNARTNTDLEGDLELKIQRTSGVLDGDALYSMRVNHCRPDIAMPQQFLDCPDVIVTLEQVAGKAVTKSMGRCPLGYSCLADRLFDCVLHMGFVQMIATIFSCLSIEGQLLGREKPLPDKLPSRIFVFLLQGIYQEYTGIPAIQVVLMQHFQ